MTRLMYFLFCFHSKLWNREFSVESQITFPGVIDCLYIPPELLDSQVTNKKCVNT